MADWDTELPLNIEDRDINPDMTKAPQERQGITSISYCLWTYYVLKQQRSFRRPDGSRRGSSWMVDQCLSREEREALIAEMENGANDKFIRYCDPIQSIDNLILTMVRTLIWTFRRVLLHSSVLNGENPEDAEQVENDLFISCMRCLEYDLNFHSQKNLKRFRWRLKSFFPWPACKSLS